MTPRRKKKDAGGRFTVEDVSSTSLSAVVAYAAALAMREGRTVLVREIGKMAPLYRCEYAESDRAVTIHKLGGPRVRA
jgi:hypothetical protein